MITIIEIMHGKTQNEYNRLLSGLAHAMRTHRRLITILGAERINDKRTRYFVKKQGVYYPYVVEETLACSGVCYVNMGFKI